MSVRRIFLMMIVPLFLLLAGVNGALLYAWEKSEAAHGLENQALAAAVTVAAFAAGNDDLAAALADPRRDAALRKAVGKIEGLEAIYLVGADGRARRIAGAGPEAPPGRFDPPTTAAALPVRLTADGRRVAPAVAPAADGRYAVALIDAEPLAAQVTQVGLLVAALVAGAGLLGLVLAGLVARRITRELARDSAMIAAIRDGAADDPQDLAIRETQDLAEAVRLMRVSVEARQARGRRELALRDRRRGEAAAARAWRDEAFPPLDAEAGGARVAVRILGEPGPGAFYALCDRAAAGLVALGECEGVTPARALAGALAARRYFEAGPPDSDVEGWIARGRRAFAVRRLAWRAWADGTAPAAGVLALLDEDAVGRAQAYGARAGGLRPAEIAEDLDALLGADGAVAVVGSAEAGEG
ncbi:MAG: hypothetical protein GC203_21240 [Phenylobacterium sp.]|uniref:hypothetical protein n=1 Tax=Phenylobacterium sp. TaxID=1871053 RepID=UPI0025EB2D6D|nr:hypothetical protein [Phenylobacterium sp.]MBI1200393.1 hypothetical protein [Phenylobacterium sp.]